MHTNISRTTVIFLFCLVSITGYSQESNSPDAVWSVLGPNTNGGRLVDVIELSNNSIIASGNNHTNSAIYKYSFDGSLQWESLSEDNSSIEKIVLMPDNSIVSCGMKSVQSDPNWENYWNIIKWGENGEINWSLDGSSEGPDISSVAIDIKTTTGDGLLVLGSNWSQTSWEGWLTLSSITLDGDLQWSQTFSDDQSWLSPVGVLPKPDGGAQLIAQLGTEPTQILIWTVDEEGIEIERAEIASLLGESFVDALRTTDGSIMLIGTSFEDGYPQGIHVVKLNASTEVIWSRIYNNGLMQSGSDIAPTVDGGFILSGHSTECPELTPDDFSTVWQIMKIDSLGNVEWEKKGACYPEDYPNRSIASAIIEGRDGSTIFVGDSLSGGFIAKFKAERPVVTHSIFRDNNVEFELLQPHYEPDELLVYRKILDAPYALYDTVEIASQAISYVDTDVENGVEYSYKFATSKGNMYASMLSEEVSGTPNASPVISELNDQTSIEDHAIQVWLQIYDPDENPVDIAFDSNPQVIDFRYELDTLYMTPQKDWNGQVTIIITGSDGLSSTSVSFELNVLSANDPPRYDYHVVDYLENDTIQIILSTVDTPIDELDQTYWLSVTDLPKYGFISEQYGGVPLSEANLPTLLADSVLFYWSSNRFLSDSIKFIAHDDGDTLNGGQNISSPYIVGINQDIRTFTSLTTSGPIEGGVTFLDENSIYAASSGDGVYRQTSSGSQLYKLSVNGSIKSSSTVTQDHTVYIASTDFNLYSFNSSGLSNANWPISLGAQATASVAVDASNNIYIGTSNGIFQSISSQGDILWGYNVGAPVYASAAITSNNIIYIINESGRVYSFDLNAINPSDVQYRWIYELGEPVISSPAIDSEGNIYVTTLDGNLYKLFDTGTEAQLVWQYSSNGAIESSPIIATDKSIYFGSLDKNIYSIDDSGNERWTLATLDSVKSTGALAEFGTEADRLYMGSDDGYLYSISLIDGSVFWRYNAGSPITCPILFSDSLIYFGTMDGRVLSIKDKDVTPNLLLKAAELGESWSTFQGNNTRTGVLGSGQSIPAISSVHPGDTDNDGDVDATDILPIGVYFLEQGDSRNLSSISWSAQSVNSWDAYPANYADCNGDGIVDEKDVIAIGVNWGESHSDGMLKYRINPSNSQGLRDYYPAFQKLYSSLESNTSGSGLAMKKILEEILEILPSEFALFQNFPNPFNPSTEIEFSVPNNTKATVVIYNIRGEVVETIIQSAQVNAGYHHIMFNGLGHGSGIYFYELRTPEFRSIKKMLLVK